MERDGRGLKLLQFWQCPDVQPFHLFACPLGFAQKSKARFYAGVIGKTFNVYQFAQGVKPVKAHKVFEYLFERNAVQRIFRGLLFHTAKV